MYSADPAGRGRGLVRQPYPGLAGFGLLLLLALAALASTRTVFPFFPLFPVVLFFFAMRTIGSAAWRGDAAATRRPTDNPPCHPGSAKRRSYSRRPDGLFTQRRGRVEFSEVGRLRHMGTLSWCSMVLESPPTHPYHIPPVLSKKLGSVVVPKTIAVCSEQMIATRRTEED